MNQALDLVGSYLIGGIVIFSVVGLTFYFNGKAQETKATEVSQRSIAHVGEIMEHDFNKLGYRVEGNDKIVNISSGTIKFLADLDNNSVVDTVEYSKYTVNNKTFIKRKIASTNGSAKEWSAPLKTITFVGVDDEGETTTIINEINSIRVKMVFEEETIKNSQSSIGAFWQRQFFPKNL